MKSNVLRVMSSNISHYMNLVHMLNADNARMRGTKLRNTAIRANVMYNGVAGYITLNQKTFA
jgi:hypothetical protein